MHTKRSCTNQTVAILTTSSSPEIDISEYASGEIFIPHTTTTVTLTYYTVQPAGTYFAAQDATPAAITQTVAADKSYPLPAALFGAARIQIRGDVAGTIILNLKS